MDPGEYFGVKSLFHDTTRSANAIANKPSMVLQLDAADFNEFANANPDLLREFNHVLCLRLNDAYDKILDTK